MADDQGIGITTYHPNRICQRFTLGDGAALSRTQVDHASSQSLHRRLKGHSGSGRGLEEEESQNLAREHSALLAAGQGLQGLGKVQDGIDLLFRKLSHAEHMPLHKHIRSQLISEIISLPPNTTTLINC